MKSFSQFITEARETKASQEAKRLGFVGNGHGDWYDKKGNLKAKTVNGELKMFGGGGTASPDDDKDNVGSTASQFGSKSKGTVARTPSRVIGYGQDQSKTNTQSAGSQQQTQVAEKPPLTIAFDKFDDDEIGDNVLAAVKEQGDGQFYIFPSRDANIKRLQEAYPELAEYIIDDKNAETIYDVLQSVNNSGYDNIKIVVRKSRADEIQKLSQEQNGSLYNFSSMMVYPVDERSVREQYISGDIFNEGDFVNSSHGIGKIIRRGANHLICLDEQGDVFRTWVTDSRPMVV
mgnify:FL=1